MPHRHSIAAALLFVCGWAACAAGPARAQTSADLFNDQALHEIRVFINSRDLIQLKQRYLENVYFPADLQWKFNGRDLRIRNVGVRARGSGSRNPIKPGLLVQFDHYAKGQQFLGLSGVVLDNAWQDQTLMREVLTMSVFRRMGQAAPRESFCRLYINNEFQGLYVIVEPIDPTFVARTVGESNSYLFEFHYQTRWFTEYLGDALAPYKAMFEPQNHKLESDNNLYGPIRDLFREANGPDDAVWRTRTDQYLDFPQYMSQVAIENVLAENDGLVGNFGVNNVYLYRYLGTNRHRFFPWDKDNSFTFGFFDISILRIAPETFPLFARAWSQPDLREQFLDTAERCAHAIGDDGWLSAEIERLVALITPTVFEDTKKQFSNDDYIAQVDFLRTFAAIRPHIVLDEVTTLR